MYAYVLAGACVSTRMRACAHARTRMCKDTIGTAVGRLLHAHTLALNSPLDTGYSSGSQTARGHGGAGK